MRLGALLALLLLPGAAWAQGGVLQSGVVTPGHVVQWLRNGVISDGGIPANSSVALPLSGRTLSVETAQSYIQLLPQPVATAQGGMPNDAQVVSNLNTSSSGGSFHHVVNNTKIYTTITGAPDTQWWGLESVVDYAGTGGQGLHVGTFSQGVRRTWNAGGISTNPGIWAAIADSVDITGQPSSKTNVQLGMEVDIEANDLDDADKREGLSVTAFKRLTGADAEISTGIGVWTGGGASYKVGYRAEFTYSQAALKFVGSTKTSASAHTILLGTNNDIAFNDAASVIMNYNTSAVGGGAIEATGNFQVDGQLYVPTGPFTVGAQSFFAGAVSNTSTVTFAADNSVLFTNQTNGAAAQTATLTNSPVAGNATFWIPVRVNGVQMHIPAW